MDRLHHIAIPVSEIAPAVEWYQSRFDVEIQYQDDSWALLKFENIAFALVLPDQHPAHFAIERIDADSYGPLTPHRDGTASIYINDPWKNVIEILAPSK